jgi:hypothetical protein
MRRAEKVSAAPPESGMRLSLDPFNNGHDVADGSGSRSSARSPRRALWLTEKGGLMRPIAKRTVEVVVLAVVLFVGIAGQAFAGAETKESTDKCSVTYGGRIATAEGDKGTFGGVAHAKGPKGQEEYQDHGPVTDINVHSIDVRGVICGPLEEDPGEVGLLSRVATQATSSETEAHIFGTATINGSGSFDYQIDLVDSGEPGTADTYRIWLSNGYDSGVQTLVGGNVQIHS